MSNTVLVQELGPIGFGTCTLTGFAYVGSIYKFEVRYTFPTADNDFNPARLVFEYAIAYRWTGFPAISGDMIEAMDSLVEVKNSLWADQVRAIETTSPEHLGQLSPPDLGIRHFMTYFDDDGCLEVLAQSAELLCEGK